MKLFLQAILKFILGVVLVGLLVFLPAGTFNYLGGLILMGILFVPMFIAGIIMLVKNPKLLASRLNAKEKEKKQDLVVKLSGLMFIAGFIVAGLDYRYKWLELPIYVNIIGSVIFILSYILYAVVLKQNTFLSRTIEEKNENWEEDLDKYTSLKELFDTLMEEYKKYFNIDKTCNKCEYYIRDQETVCPFCKTKIKK